MNTLLHYRFIKKTEDKITKNGEIPNNNIPTVSAITNVNNASVSTNGSIYEGNTEDYSQNSVSTIPQSSMDSTLPPSPASPVFNRKSTFARPVIYESEESFESQSTPSTVSPAWMSKVEGKVNHVTNGVSKKLAKFRRVHQLSESDSEDRQAHQMSDSDSEDRQAHQISESDSEDRIVHQISESDSDDCQFSGKTNSTTSSKKRITDEEDTRSLLEKVNQLKGMFPVRSTSQLTEALDAFDGDFEEVINLLMDGKFDLALLARKRKREAETNSASSGRVFKRIRLMDDDDRDQSSSLDRETRDQRLAQLMEVCPDYEEKVLLKGLEKCNWSIEDALLSLTSVEPNGTSYGTSFKGKKKEKKKFHRDEDVSDEDDEYFEDGWDSDDSMEEEEVLGQTATILTFFEEATVEELVTVDHCSKKKADIIMSLRPFNTWSNLVAKFESAKGLSYSIISGCKQTIQVRNIVTKLMKRCEKISVEMENVVTSLTDSSISGNDIGERITKKPSLLTDKFELTGYQMVGLNWLRVMHTQELNGILADEMGLGKTIQAIAFLSHLIEHGDTGPHVIIVPSSTIDNWLREARTWCPSMKMIIYYGSVDERRLVRHRILMQGRRDFNVLLTTYTIATGSVEDRSLFKKCGFHYAIFDEGHLLKNMASLRFQNLMKINAERRLLLTGTPLQNNLVELMSLLCFVMPELFIGKTEPLKKIFSMMTRGSDNNGRYEKSRIAQAKRIMKPFILRRLKSEVLKDLPKKTEETKSCLMNPGQLELYGTTINRYSNQMESGNPTQGIAMFMHLRKISNHPLLVRNIYNDKKLEEMAKLIAKEPSHRDRGALPKLIQEDMAVLNDFDINCLCKQYSKYIGSFSLGIEHIVDSGKFKYLDEILKTCQSQGDRVLLFSQFVMMLDVLEPFLKERGIRYIRLDGSTPVPERQKLIDNYNTDSDIFIFLLSTRAGGLGINLTAANTVILHDIDFNPYNDKQAEDRCHRLGQTRPVKVIRLVSKDTVEECMMRIAQEKLKLERDVTTVDEDDENAQSTDVASMLKEAFMKYKKKS